MQNEKAAFLKNKFVPLLNELTPQSKGNWGIMNSQQMIEHFADALKNASGKLLLPSIAKDEQLEKNRTFLFSEHLFRENTENLLLPKDGLPLRQKDLPAAINKLQQELDYFFEAFEKNPSLKTSNAFFGELDYSQNIQLLHKHAMHHLKQFGLV